MFSDLKASGSPAYRFVKRTFDIVCSLILMIPIGLVIAVSTVFIKAEDGGSVFYMADRIGQFGKIFKMYKLRSMKENSPDIRLADGSTYNGDDDPRVTKFGKFARKTSIDELPQVINILKGEMSFIGPRPDTPMYLDKYTEEEKIILTVRPGVTGYNQAINRNSVLTKEKLKNDVRSKHFTASCNKKSQGNGLTGGRRRYESECNRFFRGRSYKRSDKHNRCSCRG